MTVRQEIEQRIAAGVMVAPQWSEPVSYRAAGDTGLGVVVNDCFVDRHHEEGPNQSYGDGPNPSTERGNRLRTTFIVLLPLSVPIGLGGQLLIDGLWFSYIRHMGRDAGKQTVRMVYSYPDYTRQPQMRPNAEGSFNRKL